MRTIAPTNQLGERNRQTEVETLAQSQTHTEVGWTIGVITHIDSAAKMIKVADPITKLEICSNMNITLAHSVRWINDTLGQVRLGMPVLVLYKGMYSSTPTAAAFIIGDEGEKVGALKQENSVGIGFGQSLIGV